MEFVTLWLAALGTAHAAPAWTVDGTSLEVHYAQHPVATAVDCTGVVPTDAPTLDDVPFRTLGVAVVAYGKKEGTMTWGHASLRVVYCHGDALVDAEFESYRLSGWNEAQLRDEHAGEPFATGAWLTSQRGALTLFRNANPVDAGWFAEQQAANREIYEVWLDLPQAELDGVVRAAETAHRTQRGRLRAGHDLPERYHPWTRRNCTMVFHRYLPERLRADVGAPITPFAWVRRLEDHALSWVLHPSHHLVNQWDGQLPHTVGKPHPVFRRPRRIRRDALPALRQSLVDAHAEVVSAPNR